MKSANIALFVTALLVTITVLTGCQTAQPPGIDGEGTYSFSFEENMEGWQPNGKDLDNPPVEWSIERSEDMATDGNYAAKFYLNNVNDAGKIWLERIFQVKPSQSYKVDIEYDFATSDWGDMNLWTIITGAIPATGKVEPVFQGNTGNNASEETGYRWLTKSYNIEVNSGSQGHVIVMIGVWGTWETGRTYYVDNIDVTFTASAEDLAPATPTALKVEREKYEPEDGKYGDKIMLSWDENKETDLKEYRIYRSLERIGGEDFPQTPYELLASVENSSYVDSNINVTSDYPTTVYHYRISAVDNAGNESELSETVSIEYTPFG